MKKIVTILAVILGLASVAHSKDAPYVGLKYSQLKIDHSTVEGFDLNNFIADDYKVLDLHLGYNFGNWFTELGYLKSDSPSKSGVQTAGGITITGANVKTEFDGWRIGTGYNYQLNDKFSVRPFANFYKVSIDYSGSLTANSGAVQVIAAGSGSDNDNMIDVGVALNYAIAENSRIGVSYSQAVDKLEDTDSQKILSVNFAYQY
jgi:hypothetical protein